MLHNIKGLDKNIVPDKSKHRVSARSNMVTIKLRKAEVDRSREMHTGNCMGLVDSRRHAAETVPPMCCMYRESMALTIGQT